MSQPDAEPEFQMHKEKILVYLLLALMVVALGMLEFVELDADLVVKITTGFVVVFALIMVVGVVIPARRHLRRKEEFAKSRGLHQHLRDDQEDGA